MVTCPSFNPKALAVCSSKTFSTTSSSRKWFPDPRDPSWGSPLLRDLSLTFEGSASSMWPCSSVASRSSSHPNPFSTAHSDPLARISSSSGYPMRVSPLDPSPDGTFLYNSSTSASFLSPMSSRVRSVLMRRTPQLMSKPIPPGEMDPESASTAATPPMGNPYPQWMSGMAMELPTIPGRQATLAACCGALSARMQEIMDSSA